MPTLAIEAAAGLTGRLVWLGLVHSLWVGLFAASGVALFFQWGPRANHGVRHAILVVALAIVALAPIVIAVADGCGDSTAGRRATPFFATILPARAGMRRATPGERPLRARSPAAPVAERAVERLPLTVESIVRMADGFRRTRSAAIGIWATTVASLMMVMLLGALGLRRICARARTAPPPLLERSRRLSRLLGLRRPPSVLVHDGPAEPFLCGVLRPAIVLPRPWSASAPTRRLDAILAHELAHARRRDHLVNLAQRLIEVVLFFHPAVHWLSRSLRRERELCADALAVRLIGDPLALAEALESVARLRLMSAKPGALGATLGGPSRSLLPRIQELIGMTPRRPRLSVWPFAVLPAAGWLALVAAVAGSPEEPPAAPRSPQPVGATTVHLSEAGPGSPHPGEPAILGPASAGWSYGPPGPRPYDISFDAGRSQDDRQISLEVRYIAGRAGPLQRVLDRIGPPAPGEDGAWIIDDRTLRALLEGVQQNLRTNVTMAPKVTTFNGASASIISRYKRPYIAGYEKVDASPENLRPIMKELEPFTRIDITPTIVPGATRLSVQAENAHLANLLTRWHRETIGNEVVAAKYQVPTLVERRCRVDRELPEGKHLLIDLGTYEMPERAEGLPALANRALTSVGLEPVPMPRVTGKLLVSITPRQIILEPEEERGVPPVVQAKAGSNPL